MVEKHFSSRFYPERSLEAAFLEERSYVIKRMSIRLRVTIIHKEIPLRYFAFYTVLIINVAF